MNILGISASRTDRGACLLRDDQRVATAREDRPAGWRRSFPHRCIERCLEEGNIDIRDVDIIAVCDRPSLQLKRIIGTALAHAPVGAGSFLREMSLWTAQQLWIFKQIFNPAGFKGKIIFSGRHQSLAAAAFFAAPFAEAAVLSLDEGGEWATTACGTGSYNTLSIMSEQFFPHSLDFFYFALLKYMGQRGSSGETAFLQQAEDGEPVFKKVFLSQLIDLKEDGSFRLNMNYFSCCGDPAVKTAAFDQLLQRIPQAAPSSIDQSARDLACSVLDIIQEAVLKMVRHLQRSTGRKKLCLAGGSILNCVDRNRILSETAFDELYISHPAGAAPGAVLFTLHACLGRSLPLEKAGAESELLHC